MGLPLMIKFKQLAVEKGITFVAGNCSSGRKLLIEYRKDNGRTIAEITARDKFERPTKPNLSEVRIAATKHLALKYYECDYSADDLCATVTELSVDEVTST